MDQRLFWFLVGALLLSACSAASPALDTKRDDEAATAVATPIIPTPIATIAAPLLPDATNPRDPIPDDIFINFMLDFDSIRPVYKPQFVSAHEAPIEDEELIMGIAWGGEAKAYPISVLRFREMVNDELAGIPTLVTW